MKVFRISKNPTRNRLTWGIIVLIAIVAAYALYVNIIIKKNDGLEVFFRDLEKLDYIANRGLSGIYYPGNVIQVMAEGADGKEQRRDPPIILLWHTDCFPDHTPKEMAFSARRLLEGNASASLQLKPHMITALFPVLRLDSNAVADYALVLQNQRILAYARGDLDKRFSETCKNKLYEFIYEEGDKEHWFKVIIEAVVADALNLELHWKTATSAKSRLAITTGAKKGLSDIVRDITPRTETSNVLVGLKSENEKRTVISAKGLIILGYRTSSIEVKRLDEKGSQP